MTVDDRTGAVVKGTLSAALSVARIAVGIPAATPPPQLCRPEIYKALDTLREGKAKLLDPALDEKVRSGWNAATVAAKAAVQITQTYIFDPTIAKPELTGSPDADKLLAWFASPQLIGNASADGRARYLRTLTTVVRVRDAPVAVQAVPTALNGQGVIYREPAPVVVQVCAGRCTDPDPEVLATLETQVAQFGRYAVIPLVNKPFQKNNLSLSFAPNGRLENFTYGTESRFEKIATTAAESATSIEGYLAKKAADKAEDEAAAGAELKTLKAETELLKAKADKIEAEARLAKLIGSQ